MKVLVADARPIVREVSAILPLGSLDDVVSDLRFLLTPRHETLEAVSSEYLVAKFCSSHTQHVGRRVYKSIAQVTRLPERVYSLGQLYSQPYTYCGQF